MTPLSIVLPAQSEAMKLSEGLSSFQAVMGVAQVPRGNLALRLCHSDYELRAGTVSS